MSDSETSQVPPSADEPVVGNKPKPVEVVEPLGPRVVIRKDENRRQTAGGIALPDKTEIPVITGRIVAISDQIRRDHDLYMPIREYDKVLFNPKAAIPVDFENDKLFVVNVEDVVAVFRRSKGKAE